MGITELQKLVLFAKREKISWFRFKEFEFKLVPEDSELDDLRLRIEEIAVVVQQLAIKQGLSGIKPGK